MMTEDDEDDNKEEDHDTQNESQNESTDVDVDMAEDSNDNDVAAEPEIPEAVPAAAAAAITTTTTTSTAVTTSTTAAVPVPVPVTSTTQTQSSTTQSSNKRGRSAVRSQSPVVDAVTAAALAQASQQVAALGLQGLATLLVGILQPGGGAGSSGSSGGAGGLASAAGGITTGSAAYGLGVANLAQTSSAAIASATTDKGGDTSIAGGGTTGTSVTSTAAVSSHLSAAATAAAINTILPTPEQVRTAAMKAVAENPPWTHWAKNDSAIRCTDKDRLSVANSPVSGYRMARASQAVVANTHSTSSSSSSATTTASGTGTSTATTEKTTTATNANANAKQPQALYYYYECLILQGPTAQEIADALPPNARLGPKLQEQLQHALEEQGQQELLAKKRKLNDSGTADLTDRDKDNSNATATTSVGGHVRLGWSMRTGDLQAPVGYDKWSFAIRDTAGSILHASLRQDDWGGQAFGPGDVIGCAILLHPPNHNHTNTNTSTNTSSKDTIHTSPTPEKIKTGTLQQQAQAAATAPLELSAADEGSRNEIRFFKNGECLGQFVLSKGKRVGGVAFDHVESGSYYPAVSCYMGGSVRANFGPHWIHPPRRKLPAGLGKLVPVSHTSPPPLQPDDAVAAVAATAKLFRKPDQQNAFRLAVKQEASVLCAAYDEYMHRHVAMIRRERLQRGLSVQDLPAEPVAPVAVATAVSEHNNGGGGEHNDNTTTTQTMDNAMDVESSSKKVML